MVLRLPDPKDQRSSSQQNGGKTSSARPSSRRGLRAFASRCRADFGHRGSHHAGHQSHQRRQTRRSDMTKHSSGVVVNSRELCGPARTNANSRVVPAEGFEPPTTRLRKKCCYPSGAHMQQHGATGFFRQMPAKSIVIANRRPHVATRGNTAHHPQMWILKGPRNESADRRRRRQI